MTVDDGISNPSDNRPFEDVLRARLSRRSVMIGGLATAATAFFAQSGVATAARGGDQGPNPTPNRPGQGRPPAQPRIDFEAALNSGNATPEISKDYVWSVLIPWGAPLFDASDEMGDTPPAILANTAELQARQVGIGHDGMWFYPLGSGNDRGLIAINHEYGTNNHLLQKATPSGLEDVRKSQAAHGISVVEVRRTGASTWEHVVGSSYNRRITGNSRMAFSGPAAGNAALGIPVEADTVGTLNNCGNGYTPWGTYLTCEENFNGYFGWSDAAPQGFKVDGVSKDDVARYGFGRNGFGYGWHTYDARFDLTATPLERHRQGWVVEVDPMNPSSTPVKRTALGRFKHESIALVEGRGGRVVGYSGDDERFEYIYKFVSRDNWRSMRARGISPLDEGTLYVARFNDDGTGTWLELSMQNPTLAARFSSTAEIVTYARMAADLVGATPMDRPEWISVAPNGDVYGTLTNNTLRGQPIRDREGNVIGQNPPADAANPLAPNPFGHIIRWRDADQHIGTTFTWDIYVLARDTHGDTDAAFGSPDGLWVDPDGRIFIQTDGTQPDSATGPRNDQMLVGAPGDPASITRLFTGVAGCEITGFAVTPDRRTMFINVQHPGDGDPANTNFPASQDSGAVPRDCTVVITRKDGGIIGS